MAQLLITGGNGFIGSHTCLVLLQAGHRLVVLDNFSNSSPLALERVGELVGLSVTITPWSVSTHVTVACYVRLSDAGTVSVVRVSWWYSMSVESCTS